jgi:hypothetical protein
MLKELYCIIEAPLDVLKFELWFVKRGLSFPKRVVFLLVLESDAAYTSLSGHSARKSAMLVLVWCYKARGERDWDLRRYWLPEGCIKQWYDKPTGGGCPSKKCGLGEQWSSDIAVSRTLAKHSDIEWKHKIWNIMVHTTDLTLHLHSR